MDIYSANGKILSVPITPSCERVEELMRSDHVVLSWSSGEYETIPASSYIIYEGEKFYLLDNYQPQQTRENVWKYQPKFHSSIMDWQKVPFFLYTSTSKEMDWSLTATASVFLEKIVEAIRQETGEEYGFSTDAAGSASRTFSNVDVFSALNTIAQLFETEWWVDKTTKTIHLASCKVGESITLSVGENVGIPSFNENKEGFYNRFYVFGSTRNIVQSYEGANVNNLTNKRLTLSPTKYPNGYYEPYGQQEKVYSKILVFDDIYPSATNLYVTDLVARTAYVLDNEGNKIQVGTDLSGNPIWDMFTSWYFKAALLLSDGTYQDFVFNDWNYSEDPNVENGRDGMYIAGLNISVNFLSGSLQGREFELTYYKEDTPQTGADGVQVVVPAGYFGINYIKEGDYIIPDSMSLFPNVGDRIVFFNMKMPDEYITDAYNELESAMLEAIEKKYIEDQNQYTLPSYPHIFKANSISLGVGRNVVYKNGDYTFNTRVTAITRRLDYPEIQTISVGNALTTGTIQNLVDETTNANKNIETLAALNSSTSTLANAYTRAHQTMLEMMKALSELFVIDEDGNLKTTRGLYSTSFISSRGSDPSPGGGGGGSSYLNELLDVALTASTLVSGDMLVWNAANQKYEVINKSELGGGGSITLDTEMSDTSENGVQNKVIKAYSDLHPQYEVVSEVVGPEGEFMSDIIEVESYEALPAEGTPKKIYITTDDNKTYRWDGTTYVALSSQIEIGEEEGTAYDGAKGKANADAIESLKQKDITIEGTIATLRDDMAAGDQAATDAIAQLNDKFTSDGKAKNADTLDGLDSTYFASAQSVTNLSATLVPRLENVEQDIEDIVANHVTEADLNAAITKLGIPALTSRVETLETDYDTLQETVSDIAENYVTVGALNTALGKKLDKTVWEEFCKHLVVDADGNIHVIGGLYADTFLSSRAPDPVATASTQELESRVAALEAQLNELLNA